MIFSKLESAGPSLRAVAEEMGLGVVEITADDPNKVGFLRMHLESWLIMELALDRQWSTTLNWIPNPSLL